MYRAFEDINVDFWVDPGKLGFLRPSLCLFHDVATKGSQLFDALKELESGPCPAQRKLTFAACSRPSPLRELRFVLAQEREDLKVMSIQHNGASAIIEITSEGLPLVMDAVATWLAGAEDFGVSPRHSDRKPKQLGELDRQSGELWFWGPSYDGP